MLGYTAISLVKVLLLLGLKPHSWVQGLRHTLGSSDKGALRHFGRRPNVQLETKVEVLLAEGKVPETRWLGLWLPSVRAVGAQGVTWMRKKAESDWIPAPEVRASQTDGGRQPGWTKPANQGVFIPTASKMSGLESMLFSRHFLSFACLLVVVDSEFFFSAFCNDATWGNGEIFCGYKKK